VVPHRRPWRLIASTTLSCLILGCASKPPIDPLRLNGNRLIVNNRTPDNWNDVEIKINRQYRVVVPEILAGQRFDASLEAFLDVYGNHFRYARQQVKDVRLTGKLPNGQPVDLTMDYPRGGLDGLADAMKKGKS
jgi:hypothetical protein